MSHALHHRKLCPSTKTVGENVHRCLLDPGHDPRAHACICWYRWKDSTR